jgi:hypothetical protein
MEHRVLAIALAGLTAAALMMKFVRRRTVSWKRNTSDPDFEEILGI